MVLDPIRVSSVTLPTVLTVRLRHQDGRQSQFQLAGLITEMSDDLHVIRRLGGNGLKVLK